MTRIAALITAAWIVLAGTLIQAQQEAKKALDFDHDVVPLLKKHCGSCHTNGTYKGALSMDTREALLENEVVVPGKSDESALMERLLSSDPDLRMPPADQDPLNAEEIAVFRRWIDEGLPWTEGFTFLHSDYEAPLHPRRPELPPAQAGRDNPVDRIIDQYYAEHQVGRPQPIDDATFLRRVTYDLVGLPPTLEELDAFLADDQPDKRARAIDRLLDDRTRYADHWLTFWNDMLRSDYTGTGYIDGGRKPITSWLYKALYDNMPYDEFTRKLLAPVPESEGFIYGIKWRGNVNASQVREVQFAQNVAQVFLGINMKCASCHDSFIDHWKLDQAYGLAAIYAEEPLEIHRCDKPTGRMATPAFVFPELGDIDPQASQAQRLEQLAGLMTHPDNGRFSRTIVNRIWHRLMGRGIVQPVDAMGTRPWSEDLLDLLAVELVQNGYDLKHTMRQITNSAAYQSQCVAVDDETSQDNFVFRGPKAKRMTAEQFVDTLWVITGAAPAAPEGAIPWDAANPRMVRASLVRSDLLMRSLGRPNREQVVTSRPDQLTTLEAVDLANGQIITDTLKHGAKRILDADPNIAPQQLVERLMRQALSRPPNDEELQIALELLGQPVRAEGVEDLLWAIFMLPEFQLIR